MKKDILNVYKKTTDQSHADFQTKQPLDMLCEIEVKIEEFIKEIDYIEGHDPDEVYRQEKNLKEEYKKRNRDIKNYNDRIEQEKRKNNLRARMEKVY